MSGLFRVSGTYGGSHKTARPPRHGFCTKLDGGQAFDHDRAKSLGDILQSVDRERYFDTGSAMSRRVRVLMDPVGGVKLLHSGPPTACRQAHEEHHAACTGSAGSGMATSSANCSRLYGVSVDSRTNSSNNDRSRSTTKEID